MSEASRIGGNSGRSIVFVHGRGFKPGAEPYLGILSQALAVGVEKDSPDALPALADTGKSLAYYGDLSNAFLAATGEAYDEQLDLTDMSNALNELSAIDRKKGFGVNRYDRLPGKSASKEFAVSIFAPIVRTLGLGNKVVSGRHRDLGEYWSRGSEYRDATLERVRELIAATLNDDDRVVLVTHGTGSIVAYDALWQLSHEAEYAESCKDLKVDVWITLGSPLGDRLVQGHLLGKDRSGRERYPTNILAWHNVSAEDDYMSHDNTVADDFRAMLTQRQISSIRDYHIYNMSIRYGRSNPHNVLGYLVHPRVAKIVSDWLRLADGRALPPES
jgi:hypothetical protein